MSRKQTIVIKATIDMVVTIDVGDGYNPVAAAWEKARKANFIRSVEVSDEVELYEVGKVEVSESFKTMESFSKDRDGTMYWTGYPVWVRGAEEQCLYHFDYPTEIPKDLAMFNAATEEELLEVPTFGKALVTRIIEQRELRGEWRRWGEVQIKGWSDTKETLFRKWHCS